MEIKGKVVAVLPMNSGRGKNGEWKSQTVVIEYMSGQYPEKLALTNMKNADDFAKLSVGSEYTFGVNPRSREYNSRWYTEVMCYNWKFEADARTASLGVQPVQPAQPQVAATPVAQPAPAPQTQAAPQTQTQSDAGSDDLPF